MDSYNSQTVVGSVIGGAVAVLGLLTQRRTWWRRVRIEYDSGETTAPPNQTPSSWLTAEQSLQATITDSHTGPRPPSAVPGSGGTVYPLFNTSSSSSSTSSSSSSSSVSSPFRDTSPVKSEEEPQPEDPESEDYSSASSVSSIDRVYVTELIDQETQTDAIGWLADTNTVNIQVSPDIQSRGVQVSTETSSRSISAVVTHHTASTQFGVETHEVGVGSGLASVSAAGVQCNTDKEEAETQVECEFEEVAIQTTPSAVWRWRVIFRHVRRHAFLRRLRYTLNEFVRSYDGLYERKEA